MRQWFACAALLLLTACFESERPNIPQAQLVQPAGLNGHFWTVSLEDGTQPGLAAFGRAKKGAMQIAPGQTHDMMREFRLVRLIAPNLFLMIGDYEAEKSQYDLLERRDLGVWQQSNISEINRDIFFDQNLAYMRSLTARYGLSLDASDTDTTRITGNVHGNVIPALFRDRDFLATLRVAPGQAYLPNPPAPVERQELFPAGEPDLALMVMQASLPEAGWVQPDGLAGEYQQAFVAANVLRPSWVRLRPLADGRFERQSKTGTRTFGVLPIAGNKSEFLVVWFDHWAYEGNRSDYLLLSVLRRTETGWAAAQIERRGTVGMAGRIDLLDGPMNAAARRQGAVLTTFKLTGPLNASRLLALLRDGQFTTGLTVNVQLAEQFAVSDRAPEVAPSGK